MFTVRRGVNFHFFRFEELIPKIAWRVACDVGVGFLFWQRKENSWNFQGGGEILNNRNNHEESIIVSVSAESSGGGHRGVSLSVLSLYIICM